MSNRIDHDINDLRKNVQKIGNVLYENTSSSSSVSSSNHGSLFGIHPAYALGGGFAHPTTIINNNVGTAPNTTPARDDRDDKRRVSTQERVAGIGIIAAVIYGFIYKMVYDPWFMFWRLGLLEHIRKIRKEIKKTTDIDRIWASDSTNGQCKDEDVLLLLDKIEKWNKIAQGRSKNIMRSKVAMFSSALVCGLSVFTGTFDTFGVASLLSTVITGGIWFYYVLCDDSGSRERCLYYGISEALDRLKK